jgi:ribosome-binding protein aMBF1 (putative translation factor)
MPNIGHRSSAGQKRTTPEHRRVSDDLLTAVFSVMGKRGLSNKKLAAEIGISHGSIANWLSRESPISPAWVEAVQTWLEKQAC